MGVRPKVCGRGQSAAGMLWPRGVFRLWFGWSSGLSVVEIVGRVLVQVGAWSRSSVTNIHFRWSW